MIPLASIAPELHLVKLYSPPNAVHDYIVDFIDKETGEIVHTFKFPQCEIDDFSALINEFKFKLI